MKAYRVRIQVAKWPNVSGFVSPHKIHPALARAHQCVDAYLRAIEAHSLPTSSPNERIILFASDEPPQARWLWSSATSGISEKEFVDTKAWSDLDTNLAYATGSDRLAQLCVAVGDMRLSGANLTSPQDEFCKLFNSWTELKQHWPELVRSCHRRLEAGFREEILPPGEEAWEHLMVWCDRIESIEVSTPPP